MKYRQTVVISILSLISIVVSFSGCQSSSPKTKLTPEELVVSVDKNRAAPAPDDADVKRVRVLLDYLAENTTSSREEIADTASRTADVIEKDYGKKYKIQEILEGGKRIVDAIPADKRGKKDNFTAVAFLIITEVRSKDTK